jgi:hypothetical protein
MDYHVHYQGTDFGIISIEELRRRRSAGELTGDILVWRAGMPGWESLDPVLAANPAPRSGPPPVPRSAAAPSQSAMTTAIPASAMRWATAPPMPPPPPVINAT